MSFPIVSGNVIRSACRLRDGYGSDIVNVFHHIYSGSATDSAFLGPILRTALDDMYDVIQPGIPADTSFIDIDIANASTGGVASAVAWPVQTVGGGTGAQVPSTNCGLIVGRTPVSRAVARKFLGPFIATANDDGQWSSAIVSNLSDFLTAYLADIAVSTIGTLGPAIVKYVAGTVNRVLTIDSGYTSNGVYTQRRRRPGVGV